MGAIVIVLLLALVLAAAVIVYAAFPYRGHDTPLAPSLGRTMRRGVLSLPTLGARQHDSQHDAQHDSEHDGERELSPTS